jgi:acetyl-CoA/propionyl-CoA carboxylase biotin carboxyl carrier protein
MTATLFETVLVANRGEIACRIIRTLRALGIRSVAVYSDADAGARHVGLADVAVRLGGAPAAESYLSIEAVVDAARRTGAQAIHPGYGFLAENAAFARACERVGIVFVGPAAAAIEIMGDKIAAKGAVAARGVPTVPGVARPGMTDDELADAGGGIGYPLLIKPSAGGGGKGMHVVRSADELRDALSSARREAAAAFGDDTLFLERYLERPRHIEVQVLADAHGGVIHLGERECSLQRRHQKVIEEAPSPLLDADTRARIGAAACETARSVDYRGAGTVEFIVSPERPDEFFFMEMNTRLQVEHPVTEEITGVDLVAEQLRIAAGHPLRLRQHDVVLRGHSIEARVYAEDPRSGFLPTGGRVDAVHHPRGPGIRVDTALTDGLEVSLAYDPMLAKVIATGNDRDDALRRLRAALADTAVFGFPTNVEFLHLLLEDADVVAGRLDTGLIERVLPGLRFAEPDERTLAQAALITDAHIPRAPGWGAADGWRLGAPAARRSRWDLETGATLDVAVTGGGATGTVAVGDAEPVAATVVRDGTAWLVTAGGEGHRVHAHVEADRIEIADRGAVHTLRRHQPTRGAGGAVDAGPVLVSPMPGMVVSVAADGDVAAGDPIVVVEAMKMEHVVRASVAGRVEVRVAAGDQVTRGQAVATVTAHGDADPEEES